jgi:hypothetical protein
MSNEEQPSVELQSNGGSQATLVSTRSPADLFCNATFQFMGVIGGTVLPAWKVSIKGKKMHTSSLFISTSTFRN